MANTLTGLIPTIYTALDTVSRELIGFIPNVNMDAKASGAAVGQTVSSPVAGESVLEDITAGAQPAASGNATHGKVDVTITKSKAYPILWNGEEQLATSGHGQYNQLLAQQFQYAFRTIAGEVERDLGNLYAKAARATGTAGTTPFGTADLHTDWANANRVLDELGAPSSDRIMIINSAARANIEGKQSGLFKANEAGTDAMLRNRINREMHGFVMGYSAGVASHTAGSATASGSPGDYLVNGAAAAGDYLIGVDTGTGTFNAGDIVSFAGNGDKYVNQTALTGAGNLTLNTSGLSGAVTDNAAVILGAGYTANMAYHKNAMLLAARAPAMPIGGDTADDVMTVTDPVSGLTFQVAIYRQYRQVKIEVGLAWGVAMPNGKHAAILLG
jgi:hypothetical protein